MNKTAVMRNTPQRKLVLETVRQSLDHPTAETIYIRALKTAPKISLGTVYRNLAVLTELNEILKISSPCGPDHYDFNLSDHCHFVCKSCGEMCDIPPHCAPSHEQLHAPEKSGFDIHGHTLTYIGICPSCKNKKMEVK